MIQINYEELEQLEADQFKDTAFANLGDRYVPGEGDNPRVMLIGEAPGATEHMQLRPFVGDAGLILRRLMSLADLYTDNWQNDTKRTYGVANCWLTNVVKFRPPSNRKPTYQEVMAARPYLHREWVAIGRPRVIVPLGGTALHAVMGKQLSILAEAGKHIAIPKPQSDTTFKTFHVWPMLHPAYGLHNESARPQMEDHWLRFGEWLAANQR